MIFFLKIKKDVIACVCSRVMVHQCGIILEPCLLQGPSSLCINTKWSFIDKDR